MKIIKKAKTSDLKVAKYLQRTRDNQIIETGYYNLDEYILCLSTQVGCSMGCVFCASSPSTQDHDSDQGFRRNLTTKEIVKQAQNILKEVGISSLERKGILFSYMGTGEPLLNYDNVVKSIHSLFKIYPNSRATVSTVGVDTSKMRALADQKFSSVVKLHLSLHAPNDKLRKKLLPNAGEIQPALEALQYFSERAKQTVKVNYVLIKNINDSVSNAIELSRLLEKYKFIVKLSALNPFNNLLPSPERTFKIFEDTLVAHRLRVCRFYSAGTDIRAGCGQFSISHT